MNARLLCMVLTWCVLLCPAAAAETLVIGLGDADYPPYQYDISGKPKGLCIDTVDETAKRMGLAVRYERSPWNRLLDMVRKGTLDAMLPILRTPEREEYMIYPDTPLAKECLALFTTTDTNISYDGDLHQLQDIPIGTVLNYSYGPQFDNADCLLRKRSYTDRELVLKVLSGKIKVGAGSLYVVWHYAEQEQQRDRIRLLRPFLSKSKLYLAFSRASDKAHLATAFGEALAKVQEENPDHVYPFCDQ